MKYKIGDRIPNGEVMLRRLQRYWVNSDQTISLEAFRPRIRPDGQFEDGVSVDLQCNLREPIGNDYWSNKRKMATGQILSDTINALVSYEIVYNGPSPSHCIIAGDMEALWFNESALRTMANGTTCIHMPS